MQITPRDNVEDFSLPLPIYKSIHMADAVNENGEQFKIFVGMDKKMVIELKKLSSDETDTELQKNTSDFKRFYEEGYQKWYKKGRTPFALMHNRTNNLAGIIWLGPKLLGRKSRKHLSAKQLMEDESKLDARNWHTISYRSYLPFRGKGLMGSFGKFVVDFYLKKFPNIKLWTSTNNENTTGTAYASSLGFKLNEEVSDREANWLVMIR